MSASTQPPPTVPMNAPSSKTTIFAPTCCGVEPLVFTTVAMAAARAPSSNRLYISRKTSADDSGAPNNLRKSNDSAISFLPEIACFHITQQRCAWASSAVAYYNARIVDRRGARHGVPPSGGMLRICKLPPEGGTPCLPLSLGGFVLAQGAQAVVQPLLGGFVIRIN